ncbi:TetR/AcrR family transcriptional regulator [Streptomyces sp. NBC_01267]|uniref:TetR/AcrR family transcriptional regulator n=1 Tax=unclassified Streptomyces TaxID=2593676 RepID=UPI002DDC803E|nr:MULTISPECIES: helix-turn-helix domain-containing protein [unclassified Streptomyces]WSC21395.1 TetR/AcrR family transcriptional regulator [Streptomyces sp. NBC_01766]
MDRAQKRDTSLRIWRIAIELFVERGFGKVSVTEIAEAADVSKMTVFNYFGNKEDMVLKPMEGHTEDMARAVRERPPGESAVAAVHRQFLDQLAAHDASVGMNADPMNLRVRELILATPALLTRTYAWSARSTQLLADELIAEAGRERGAAGEAVAHCVAMQIAAARASLMEEIHRRRIGGESVDEICPVVVTLAQEVFGLAENGLGEYAVRR